MEAQEDGTAAEDGKENNMSTQINNMSTQIRPVTDQVQSVTDQVKETSLVGPETYCPAPFLGMTPRLVSKGALPRPPPFDHLNAATLWEAMSLADPPYVRDSGGSLETRGAGAWMMGAWVDYKQLPRSIEEARPPPRPPSSFSVFVHWQLADSCFESHSQSIQQGSEKGGMRRKTEHEEEEKSSRFLDAAAPKQPGKDRHPP
ncbi:hypothetical protein QBC46DRAFT_418490 [Diplogelasinospora grovesii]|uniref:Uncharacterized protein n=1 Tax=Diplogelasinospora grovesii TaxID=303347 RepID=A0AAN6N0A2_9PEZI|nr:hypothetical protein QBC46DRAFT_418490 [Diplogelasinospora grovesii]